MNYRRSTVVFMVVLMALIIFVTSLSIASEQSLKPKAISFINNVLGLDTSKYNITLSHYLSDIPGQTTLPTEKTAYSLTSNDQKIDFSFVFSSNSFLALNIYQFNNSLTSASFTNKLPLDTLTATKTIIQRLQAFQGDSYLQLITDSLNSINDVESVNGTSGSINRQVTTYSETLSDGTYSLISYHFTYILNDVLVSSKSVNLEFANNYLKFVSTPWNFYNVATDKILITQKYAVEMAKENASNASSDPIQYRDSSITVKLNYIPRDEPSKLFPFWFVELPLNYPKSTVTGWQVGIWADTGEVEYGHPTGVLGSIPDVNNQQVTPTSSVPEFSYLTILPILLTIPIVLAIVRKRLQGNV